MSVCTSDVCVIGGGVIGLSAAASLRDRGIDVACLERSRPGDAQSAGRTRQFRHLHRDPELIDLAVCARSRWLEWEERFGRTLLGSEGALRLGGDAGELDALRAAGVPAVAIEPSDVCERFPILASPDVSALWDPLAGAIRAADTIAELAEMLGAAVRWDEVTSVVVQPGGEAVEVRTRGGVHRSARCVVCAGAGTDALVRPLGLDVHQERQAHVRLTFRTRVASARPLPCFSDRRGDEGDHVYAVTDLGDRYAVGLATLATYPAVEDLAIDVPADVDVASQRERIIAYVRRVLPGLDPQPVGEVLRLTTTLRERPEDGFLVWREGPIVAVAGRNLFKFAPVIGERVASAATGRMP